VAEVHVAHEADLLERVEVAVYGREVQAREPAAEAGGDLLRGDRALGRVQRLDHEAARGRDAQAAPTQRALGNVGRSHVS
jgi:hypothetical protein